MATAPSLLPLHPSLRSLFLSPVPSLPAPHKPSNWDRFLWLWKEGCLSLSHHPQLQPLHTQISLLVVTLLSEKRKGNFKRSAHLKRLSAAVRF